MADENNTADLAASLLENQEGAPVSQSQDTGSTSAAASTENQGKKYADRFDTTEALEQGYKAAQAELTRMKQAAKTSPREVANELLGTEQIQQVPQNAVQAEQMAREAGGNPLVQALRNLKAQHGEETANIMLMQYLAKQEAERLVQETLAPVQAQSKESEMHIAWTALASEYDFDPTDKAMLKAVNESLAARPKWKEHLQSVATRQDMYEILELAYGRAKKQTSQQVAQVAKAAGAKGEQIRSAMSAASAVESGRAANNPSQQKQPDAGDAWLQAMQRHERAAKLFE